MVTANSGDSPPVADIVFLVEGTANLAAHIDELKTAYILPTLQYFSGGPPDPTDYGLDYSCTLYDLVVFHSADIAPHPAVQCSMPTTSTHEVIKWIDQIKFVGGAGEKHSHIAEAISTALQVFVDIGQLRENRLQTTPVKHCILVCNSPPYQLTVNESVVYAGLSCEDLIALMAMRGINFSIFSPKKISSLFELFEIQTSNRSPAPPIKDYATDPRHMVLIRGYELEERSHTPKLEEDKLTNERLHLQLAENAPASSTAPSSLAPTDGQFKVPAATAPSQTTAISNQAQAVTSQTNIGAMTTPTMTTQLPPTTPQPNVVPSMTRPQASIAPILTSQDDIQKTQINSTIQGGPRPFIGPGGMTMRPLKTMPSAAPHTMTTNAGPGIQSMMAVQNSQNTAIITPQPAAPPINPTLTRPVAPVGDMTTPNAALPQLPAAQQRKIIWTGALEWQEKSKVSDSAAKVPRSLACQVLAGVNETLINASKWPNKLVMQLVPQTLINPLHDLFAQSRTVVFQFNNMEESYRSLFRLMSSGFAGCVHFAQVAQCDVRVLMLLYHHRRKMFMGIIPRDQTAFIQGIRQVITKHKKMAGNGVAGQGCPPATPQTLTSAPSQNAPIPSQLPIQQGVGAAAASVIGPSGSGSEAERQANLQKIRTLYQDLELATQKERQFQQQQQFVPGSRAPMTAAQQRQFLQQQQAAQTGAPQQAPALQQATPQARMPMNVPPGTTQQQLRHLLLNQQQQQMHQMMQQQRMPGNQAGMMQAQPGQGTGQSTPQTGFMDEFHMNDML